MTETTAPRPAGRAGEREIVIDGRAYRAQLDAQGVEHVWDACWKCGGSGYLSWTGVDDGRCWACHTTKGKWIPVRTMERRAKDRARRAAKRSAAEVAKAAKVAAQLLQFEADHPELAFMTGEAVHDPEVEMNHIVRDIAMRLQSWGSISDPQVTLCSKIVREDDERRALRAAEREMASPAPSGRVVVEGEVVMVRAYEGDYGTTWKMMVRADDGWKAFVSIPRDLEPSSYTGGTEDDPTSFVAQVLALKGQRVRFTATLAPKADDPTFAIAKRPTKAEVIEADGADPIDLQDEAAGDFTPGA